MRILLLTQVLVFGFLLNVHRLQGQSGAHVPPASELINDTLREAFKKFVPSIHDELVSERLQCLQKEIPLTFHRDVRRQIERYLVRQRGQVEIFLARKHRYFPIFEEILAKHGMPEELKYLSVVESALLPKAQSWAAAVGLWQFIPGTGKEYGLRQDHYIDERIDPYKATEAACKYLKYLYNMFGDWHLALAAYNSGPGRVQWAVRSAGGKGTFWDIYPYLPNETKAYVPMFIAINYVMNFHDEHNVAMPLEVHEFTVCDTICVNQNLSLIALAKQLNTPLETLQILNPHLKKNIVPSYLKNYPVRIPKDKVEYFAANREQILKASERTYVTPVPYTRGKEIILTKNLDGKKKITHYVRRGEYMAAVARQYGVSTSDLMVWNKLTRPTLYANQRLVVWIDKPENLENKTALPSTQKEVANKLISNVSSKPSAYYTVQAGDTLWSIARKHPGLSVDKIKEFNPDLKEDALSIGQKLRVN